MTSPEAEDDQHREGDGDPPPPPKPTAAEVAACQFSSWYPAFRGMDPASIQSNTTHKKKRKNVTMESVVIRPLPSEFLDYLRSDGVRLPECATKVSSCMNDADRDDGRWDSSSEEGDGEEENDDAPKKYSFPALTEQIQSALTQLGGERNAGCMPKLNWSAPKDAAWINCGSLKCTKVGDVYLLLKSSDFVGFDLERAWEDLADDGVGGEGAEASAGIESLSISRDAISGASSEAAGAIDGSASTTDASRNNIPQGFEYELVLRKWCNLHPSMEFRCFVCEHELVAISQRHPSKFYPHLQPPLDGSIHPSLAIIEAFFDTYVCKRFAAGKVHKYVLDLYIDSQERVWIVDFNVWAGRTDALLFDWGELVALGEDVRDSQRTDDGGSSLPMPEIRLVTKDMKSMTYDPLSSYRGPTDVMDLLNGGNGSEGIDGSTPAFEEFMRQCVRPSEM